MMNGGGMGTLSPALSGRLQSAIAGGLFPATALDPKILGDLGALPEHMASVVLDRFLSSNMANVRNPSAFLVGVMNRYKSEVQAGGVAIPPAPPPQLLGLAAAALLGLGAATKGMGGAPSLGFNNCNIECCNETMPNAFFVKRTADLFVKLGLKEAGYLYVNMDDCWEYKERAQNGTGAQVPVVSKFPDGIKNGEQQRCLALFGPALD